MKNDSKKDNIDFITKKGTAVQLRWKDNEYKAYKIQGGHAEFMNLGAVVPNGLIEYIKERF